MTAISPDSAGARRSEVSSAGEGLAGRVVVITGSTRGIGRAIADECARRGAEVVISSSTPADVERVVAEFVANGHGVSGIACDVGDVASVRSLFEHALETWGHIDAWVNNAGVSQGMVPVDEMDPAQIERIVRVNLTGTLLGCRQVLPYFREHGGTVLNIPGRGYRGDATPYTAVYAATKAAVASLTRSLAVENKDAPVSVHALVPGMVDTAFYDDVTVSPRLSHRANDWRYALDAFGVSLEEVGRGAAELLAQRPGVQTGQIVSALKGTAVARGIAKMTWLRLTGKVGRD